MKTLFPFLAAVMLLSPAYAFVDFYSPFLPDEHTLGLWHFDEQPGSTAVKDSSGNKNDGTLLTDFANKLDPNKTWKKSIPGFSNCVYTNTPTPLNMGVIRVDQDEATNTLSIVGNSDLTIEFWMNPNRAGPENRTILQKYTGANYHIVFVNSRIHYVWYGSSQWQSQSDVTDVPLNTWTHVTITVDRTSFRNKDIITFYINGLLSSRYETLSSAASWDNQDFWIIGRHDGAEKAQYLGKLDELRISNIIRTYPSSKAKMSVPASNSKRPESLKLILFE